VRNSRPSPPAPRPGAITILSLVAVLALLPALARAAHHRGEVAADDPVWVGPVVVPNVPIAPPIVVPPVHCTRACAARHDGHDSHGCTIHDDADRLCISQWDSDDPDAFEWAVVGDSRHGDKMGSGLTAELADVADANGGPVLWFRLGGRGWLVRDAATVQRARELLEPMQELGREMGRVGGEEGRLGGEMGRHGAEVGRLAGKRAALEVKLALDGLNDDEDRLDDGERDELQQRIEELQREQERSQEAGERADMRQVQERMHELGQRLGTMGRRMKELSHRAETDMRALARKAQARHEAVRFDGVERHDDRDRDEYNDRHDDRDNDEYNDDDSDEDSDL
jgi:hypothetical protein